MQLSIITHFFLLILEMSSINSASLIIFIYCILFQLSFIDCRPHNQRLLVQGHQWTVPDEPGWEDVLKEAEPVRSKFLSNCASSRECRLAVDLLRKIFLKHKVSAKYYAESNRNEAGPSEMDSIFKWG
ncbi:unnamed protein product [Rotaria socialis]